MRAAVIGAGTAGLAASVFLARLGVRVELFERAHKLDAVGAGLLLQPTGLSVLVQLGAFSTIAATAARVDELQGVNTVGLPVVDLRYSNLYPGAYGVGIHRATLCAALLDVARAESAISIHLASPVEALDYGDAGKPARVRLANGDATPAAAHTAASLPFDLLVIASGTYSSALRPAELVTRAREYPWGAFWAVVPDRARRHQRVLRQVYRDTRTMLGVLPTGAIYRGRDAPASERLANDALAHVSLFWSCRADKLSPAWRDAPDALASWKRDVLAVAPISELLDELTDVRQLLWARYSDVRLRRFHTGRAVFLGDAAHATSPQLGQGVNMALLDAAALGSAIERLLSSDETSRATERVPAALANYTHARERHLGFYQRASDVLTPLFQSSAGLPLSVWRDLFMGMGGKLWPFKRLAAELLAGYKTGVFSAARYPDPELVAQPATGVARPHDSPPAAASS